MIEINCWLYLGEDYSVDFKEGGGIGQCVGTSWEGYNEMGVRSSTNIGNVKADKVHYQLLEYLKTETNTCADQATTYICITGSALLLKFS